MKIKGVVTTSISKINGVSLASILKVAGVALPVISTTTTTTSGGFTSATGGTVTTSGDYKIHTFTTVGSTNFVVSTVGTAPNNKFEILVVAGGGGGGGGFVAGGGGGGGVIENTNYKIAMLGAPSDRMDMEDFISEMKIDKIENLAGSLSFSNYYHFLHNECKVMLTVDSAPLHIAQKLNLPTLSVWGPTTPDSRIEVNERNRIVFHKVICTPCVHISGILPCKGDNFCIKGIGSIEIIRELRLML